MTRLPVRPRPAQDESFPGYLLRLTTDNGWESLKQFVAAYKIKSSQHLDLDNSRLLEAVSELTGHPRSIIESACLPSELQAVKRDDNRHFHVLATSTPCVCLQCITDGNNHQAQWQYLPFTYCLEHKVELISKCPMCDSEFNWDSALVGGRCSECGAAWRSMIQVQEESLPDYLEDFLAYNDLDEQRAYLCDLTLAALRIIRPYDELLDITERPTHYTVSWTSVFSKAYALLTDLTVIENHFHACAQTRGHLKRLGLNAVYAPLLALRKKLQGEWPLHHYKPEAVTVPVGCNPGNALGLSSLPSRTRYVKGSEVDEKLRAQTDLSGLADIFGCDSSDVSSISEHGIFHPFNRGRISRDSIFDVEQVANKFSIGNVKVNMNGLYNLKDLGYLLPLYNASWDTVLIGIAKRKIPAYRKEFSSTFIEGVYINKDIMKRFLKDHFYSSCHEKVSISTASKIIRVPIAKFKDMAKSGILVPQRWFSSDVYLVEDLIKLLEQYLIISRCSKLHGIPRVILKQRAMNSGASPIIGDNIYVRSNDLESSILEGSQ